MSISQPPTEPPSDDQPQAGPSRVTPPRGALIAAAAALCLLLLASLGAWRGFVYWYEERGLRFADGGVAEIVVAPGSSVRTVAEAIEGSGLGVSAREVMIALRWRAGPGHIHAGRYRFPSGLTLRELADRLCQGMVETVTLRVSDGMTIWQLRRLVEAQPDLVASSPALSDERLAETLGISEGSPEGWFAPETYKLNSGSSDLAFYRLAHARQKELLGSLWEERDAGLPLRSPYEALILASIIEKETSRAEDRALIASVLHNRLRRGMPLQADPTIIYSLGESFDGDLRRQDLLQPGPYNTYRNIGLPPTPIAMPGRASLWAALHPADSRYLYFVARGDGTTEFSRDLNQHNRAVDRYQRGRRR